jgi:hypothetical protein
MSNEQDNDISRKGCFVSLSVSMWGASKKLGTDEVDVGEDADPTLFSTNMALIDKAALKPIRSIANEGTVAIKVKALPFDLRSISFVPNGLVAGLVEELDGLKTRYWQAVDGFLASYASHKEQARAKLGEHFDETHYPSVAEMRGRFDWRVRVVSMESPQHMAAVDPRIFAQIQREFQAEMAEFRQTAMDTLRGRFVEMVAHLAERLTPGADGKAKTFKDASVNHLQDFLRDFESLNIADDQTLKREVERMRGLLDGKTGKDFRGRGGDLQQDVAQAMQKAAQAIGGMLTDQKRRIKMPGAQTAQEGGAA